MFKKIFHKFFKGRIKFQKLFEFLYKISLSGMNFGGGQGIKNGGSGEINVIKFLEKLPDSDKSLIIFDVGAHVGNYSMMILENFKNKKALVYAFEPAKTAFWKLKNNLKDKAALLYNFGFGEKNKESMLFYDREASDYASVYKRDLSYLDIEMNLSEKIEVRTIDSFCSENNLRHIYLLKIDAEGSEMNILKGANEMLKNNQIDLIQFEFGGPDVDSCTFFKDFYYLLSPQYDIYRILKDGFRKINRYNENQEIFLTANYLAKRKNICT